MFILLGLIALYFLILPFGVKRANTYKNALLDNFVWMVFFAFLVGISVNLAGYKDSAIYEQCIHLTAAIIITTPYLAIRKILRRKKKKSVPIQNIMQEEVKPDLPDNVDGRERIVRKFSDKYNLCLRDEEIDKIVNGSFNSIEWAREIEAMKKQYSTESEWYNGDTDWIRAYLKAFYVQNVSSDFELQREICLANFNEIFEATDMSSFYSIDECIEYINNRYMTNFNDVSFMIAYRFLEENGKTYRLPSMGIVKATSEIDRLTEKYDTIGISESGASESQNNKSRMY